MCVPNEYTKANQYASPMYIPMSVCVPNVYTKVNVSLMTVYQVSTTSALKNYYIFTSFLIGQGFCYGPDTLTYIAT